MPDELAALPKRIARQIAVDGNDCWLWTGKFNQAGYGVVSFGGGQPAVYVILWALKHGDIPGDGDGMALDHLCSVRACCNPRHLEVVTYRENALRGDTIAARHAAKVACPQGHPYDKIGSRGQRICSECGRAAQRRYQASGRRRERRAARTKENV